MTEARASHAPRPASALGAAHSPSGIVVAALLDATLAGECERLLPHCRLLRCRTVLDTISALRKEPGALLIVPVAAEGDAVTAGAVASLCTRYAGAPIIALFQREVSSVKSAVQLGVLGVEEIVTVPAAAEDGDSALRDAAQRLGACGYAADVVRVMPASLPRSIVPMLAAAVSVAHRPVSAAGLAAALGTSERTLRRQCANECLPSPQWIIGWARLLLVARHLQRAASSLASVAALLGYPSDAAMGAQVRRYLHVTPSTLRHAHSVDAVYRCLEDAVQRHQRLLPHAMSGVRVYPELSLIRTSGPCSEERGRVAPRHVQGMTSKPGWQVPSGSVGTTMA